MSDVMHNSWVERDALGRRPSQGSGKGGGSIWESDPAVKAAAARVCEAYGAGRRRTGGIPRRWQERARCQGTDLGLWFQPERGQRDASRERRAKRYCRVCPVAALCLEWAYEVDDQFAILGGLNPAERNELRPKIGVH